MRSVLVLALLLVSAPSASAQSAKPGELIKGEANVIDGDTIDIASNRIRIWGIDAPERNAWCFENGDRWKPARQASAALGMCTRGKVITCRVQKIETRWFRKRFISECWTDDGQDVGDCMVRGGWATDFSCYSGGFYKDRETEAKNAVVGLWRCDNGPPTRRWGRKGRDALCETPIYKPTGP